MKEYAVFIQRSYHSRLIAFLSVSDKTLLSPDRVDYSRESLSCRGSIVRGITADFIPLGSTINLCVTKAVTLKRSSTDERAVANTRDVRERSASGARRKWI